MNNWKPQPNLSVSDFMVFLLPKKKSWFFWEFISLMQVILRTLKYYKTKITMNLTFLKTTMVRLFIKVGKCFKLTNGLKFTRKLASLNF